MEAETKVTFTQNRDRREKICQRKQFKRQYCWRDRPAETDRTGTEAQKYSWTDEGKKGETNPGDQRPKEKPTPTPTDSHRHTFRGTDIQRQMGMWRKTQRHTQQISRKRDIKTNRRARLSESIGIHQVPEAETLQVPGLCLQGLLAAAPWEAYLQSVPSGLVRVLWVLLTKTLYGSSL